MTATILVLSSYVASSRVGGTVAMLMGPALQVRPVVVPTVTLGRHPGHGPPGGGAVSDELFASMLEGVVADGVLENCHGILTGYFASPAQVKSAVRIIERAREARQGRELTVMVDPIMGDETRGLYIQPDTAHAIISDLAPCADLVTPNLWELAHGWNNAKPVSGFEEINAISRRSNQQFIVTSVPYADGTGIMLVDGKLGYAADLPIIKGSVPHGVGDAFAFLTLSRMVHREQACFAAHYALKVVHAMICDAVEHGQSDLPVEQALSIKPHAKDRTGRMLGCAG